MPASKLQLRILTALLIAPLAIAGVLLLPTSYLALCLGTIMLLAAWEWAALAGIPSPGGRIAYLILVALCMLLLWQPALRPWYLYLTAAASVFWVAVTLVLFRLSAIAHKSRPDPATAVAGLVVLVAPWVAIIHLHAREPDGPYLVLFLLLLIWAADILAYFTGRRWGREKLAPVLSPGKTRAGLYGALTGAAVCGILLGWWMGSSLLYLLLLVALCILVALVSVVGDLFESLMKRSRALKDSGHLLPGHGGILDRIDSLTAAAPPFTLGILWLEALAG